MQLDVRINLGDLWRAQGPAGAPSAAQCYGEALRREPGHAAGWRGLGDCHREAGAHDQAIVCYKVCLCVFCGAAGPASLNVLMELPLSAEK